MFQPSRRADSRSCPASTTERESRSSFATTTPWASPDRHAASARWRPGRRALLPYVYFLDVALGTGLRFGELRALRWRDLDFERRIIRVEQAYSRRELKRPKSAAGIRSVPLFPTVAAALRALAARAVEREQYAPDELIFQTAKGTALHESNFRRRVWDPALRPAGLAERVIACTIFAIRASHASSPRVST